jgi:hypothetical protein
MIISGLLLTLSEDARLAEGALSTLRARPEFTLAERSQRWLPVVVEVENVRASRDLHDWLNSLPGVDFVDVVQVNFEEEAAAEAEALGDSEELRVHVRPHPGPLPQEREKPSPSHPNTRDWAGGVHDQSSKRKQTQFPLPGGEGQGEGGLHTIHQSRHHSKRRMAAPVQDADALQERAPSILQFQPKR